MILGCVITLYQAGFFLLIFFFFLICRVVDMTTRLIAYSGIKTMAVCIVVQMINILWSGIHRHAK